MNLPLRCPFTGKFLFEYAERVITIKCRGCKKNHSFALDGVTNTYLIIDTASVPV
jgi:phage FluMu protein Com